MKWLFALGTLAVVTMGAAIAMAGESVHPFESWLKARELAQQEGLGVAANRYFSKRALSSLGWPEKGKAVEGWLRYPLFAVWDVYGHYEQVDQSRICLLVNGYARNGEPRTVSLRFVQEDDGLKIARSSVLESDEAYAFPDHALCPDELDAQGIINLSPASSGERTEPVGKYG